MPPRSAITLDLRNGAPRASVTSTRLTSLDAFRGFIMLAMASAGLGIPQVAKKCPGTWWESVATQLDHTQWVGCTLWDLIQPAFMFMVGTAVAYSYARRQERGDSWLALLWHALGRVLLLVALGVFLKSLGAKQTVFQFTNVLAQIGLGYLVVFLLRGQGLAIQGTSALVLLAGYGYLFYQYPVPEVGAGFDHARWGLPNDWPLLTGIQAHWNPNMNYAAHFDQWFLNLFPTTEPFVFRARVAGYQTLNFVPSIATMLFGLMAGEWLRSGRSPRAKLSGLLVAGAVLLGLGLALGLTVCPIVKRIWTPSWALFSGAWVLWMLAGFYAVIDVAGHRRWAFPLVVVGMNSLAMYLLFELLRRWTWEMLQVHVGWIVGGLKCQRIMMWFFGPDGFPQAYMPIVQSLSVLGVFWCVCWWLYRRKVRPR